MLKRFIRLGTLFVFGSTLTWAAAASPVWGLNEVYSNADGSVQFVVHSTGYPGQQHLGGLTLVASGQDTTHTFVFPSDLPGDSRGRSFLIATQGFADLNVLQPDYVVPNGFFPTSGGTISVAGHSYPYGVPTDGAQAYWLDPDFADWYGPAVATNFAGERYAVTAATQARAIGPGLTGTWFNPVQSGHGFAIEVLPGTPMQMLATWFTFAPQGGQSWIFGLGPISGDGATMQGIQAAGAGARFPPNLDAADIQVVPWGTLTFRFSDCNHGHVDWASTVPGYGSGGMDLTRLTLPAGLSCPQ